MKLNEGKCKTLHLGRNNLVYWYRIGSDCLESSFAEKALVVLFNELNMSQQCALATRKAKSTVGCIWQSFTSR